MFRELTLTPCLGEEFRDMPRPSGARRLRILISAYACEPDKGSEPGIGWNLIRAVAQHHDVWVITRANNRRSIERELAREPVPSLHPVYFDLPKWARWWKRGARGTQPYYYLWQLALGRIIGELCTEHRFDVCQHATFGRYWAPSLLHRLPIPFIWGPVGGGESAPFFLWKDCGARGRIDEGIRSAARWLGEHDPLVRATARQASVALAVTDDTRQRLLALGTRRISLFSAMGLRRADMSSLLDLPLAHDSPVRFISIGRMLPWKGFHSGLRAFAAASLPLAEYWLVGGGPAVSRLQRLAADLGVSDRVRFFGSLSRTETLRRLAQCHALVHPSLHDSGGWVCLESMAAGRPVVCLALGGPAEMVTPETGFLIATEDAAQVHRDLTSALKTIATEPALRARLGAAGRARVLARYTWEAKGEHLSALYSQLTNDGAGIVATTSRQQS